MNAALLNNNNQVIGEVFEAPKKGYNIQIAGCFTVDNIPVNVRNYKISRSKKNLDKAAYCQPVSKFDSKHGEIYTFSNINQG